jgi:hypothetical protein
MMVSPDMQRVIAALTLCPLVMGLHALAQDHSPEENQKSAKAAPPTRPKPGLVSGRIFEITNSGDLKPARMAKIYLFSHDGSEGSAAHEWSVELRKGLLDYIKGPLMDVDSDGAPVPRAGLLLADAEKLNCQRELLIYDALSSQR